VETEFQVIDDSNQRYKNIQRLFFMHLPDLLTLTIGLFLGAIGHLKGSKVQITIEFLWLPLVTILLITVGTMQRGVYALNICRAVLSSTPFLILGYCCFPIYLFQRIFLEDYLYRVHLALNSNYQYNWPALPLWERFVAVLITIGICWLSQKFYADPVASTVYPKLKSIMISSTKT
jgi:peptidoglycan/LPS O-acetylase OafA/YrhL